MIYGYCRYGIDENRQDIERQERELLALGVEKENIFREKGSGRNRNRVELNRMLEKVQPKDTIIATEPSQITRSTKDFIEFFNIAKNKSLKFVLGTFEADFAKDKLEPMTEGILKMLGAFVEPEKAMFQTSI